jgi:hypothetical protein
MSKTSDKMHMALKVFTNKKSRWRQRVRRHLLRVDQMAKEVVEGRFLGGSQIMEAAHITVTLGQQGLDIVTELNSLKPPKMVETRAHVAALCGALEYCSIVLEYLMDEQDLPKGQFPLYRSELNSSMQVELTPLESTDFILKQIERSAKEEEDASSNKESQG